MWEKPLVWRYTKSVCPVITSSKQSYIYDDNRHSSNTIQLWHSSHLNELYRSFSVNPKNFFWILLFVTYWYLHMNGLNGWFTWEGGWFGWTGRLWVITCSGAMGMPKYLVWCLWFGCFLDKKNKVIQNMHMFCTKQTLNVNHDTRAKAWRLFLACMFSPGPFLATHMYWGECDFIEGCKTMPAWTQMYWGECVVSRLGTPCMTIRLLGWMYRLEGWNTWSHWPRSQYEPSVLLADPCAPNKDDVMLPDPQDNRGYYICYKGSGSPSKCFGKRVFDPKKSVCVNP